MKIKDIRQKSIDELRQLLKESRLKLGSMYFDKVSKPLKDNQEIKKTRRLIARILTIMSERENKGK